MMYEISGAASPTQIAITDGVTVMAPKKKSKANRARRITQTLHHCATPGNELTYTPPAEIEGEPEDVRELSLQQLGEAAGQFAQLTLLTIVQLRAASLERYPSVEAWATSPEGVAAIALSRQVSTIVEGVKRLSEAE
jgi:hypothetical protein